MVLLAKGKPDQISLKQHLEDVFWCASSMVSTLKPYLDEIDPNLADNIKYAAIYHDLGKTASGMQKIFNNGGRWDYRHEVLSAAILISAGIGKNYSLAIAAILTHHKPINELIDSIGMNVDSNTEDYFLHQWCKRVSELSEHWGWVNNCIQKTYPEFGDAIEINLPDNPDELKDIRSFANNLSYVLCQPEYSGLSSQSLPYIAARGILMAADHLASSGIKEPMTDLPNHIDNLRHFQQYVADHKGSVMLEAPTGSGKTRAAIAWALSNRKCGERIFYVLPYQASINAMAKTLINDDGFGFGDSAVGIIHHNALLQEFRSYFDSEADNYEEAKKFASQRLDQTRQFYRPIKIITPYQILKLLFGCKRYELGLVEMLGGLVIFDEIHAYDVHISALIEEAISRLRPLGVRFLLMTATFPDFLRQRLSEAMGGGVCLSIKGSDDWERHLLSTARHRLRVHQKSLDDMIIEIVKSSKEGTVLVVCNRIEQAKEIYNNLSKDISSISVIHGGFTARDRYEKEKMLFAEPGSRKPAKQVLVSTQVIEVSLDISFDTIFTEIAPVDDLLQRFGRVNRVYEHEHTVDVHVAAIYDHEKVKYIYDEERLALTLEYAPYNSDLTPGIEREWIKCVYANGYLPNEEKKYALVKESFKNVINNLKPMFSGNDDDEFYSLFDNIPVLPVTLYEEYRVAYEQGRFLEASQLLMSLSIGSFKRLEMDGAIELKSFQYRNKKEKIAIVKRRYDPVIGLLDEPEYLPAELI